MRKCRCGRPRQTSEAGYTIAEILVAMQLLLLLVLSSFQAYRLGTRVLQDWQLRNERSLAAAAQWRSLQISLERVVTPLQAGPQLFRALLDGGDTLTISLAGKQMRINSRVLATHFSAEISYFVRLRNGTEPVLMARPAGSGGGQLQGMQIDGTAGWPEQPQSIQLVYRLPHCRSGWLYPAMAEESSHRVIQ